MSDFFLYNLKSGEEGIVVGYNKTAEQKILRRLLELGFYLSAKIKVHKKSYLNNVLLVEINGYMLSVRKDIAKNIIVQRG